MDERQNTLLASTNPAYGITGESKNYIPVYKYNNTIMS